MLSVVGNLSEKGLSFFKDPDLRYELHQDDEIDIASGSTAEFYVGVKHRVENQYRYGKILNLEENSFSFMLDFIEEEQGSQFRNYDNIESISIETTFDARGFLKNMLLDKMDWQFYQVLDFISKDHIIGNPRQVFKTCAAIPDLVKPCSCGGSECQEIFEPDGWWGQEEWPPSGYYNFFTDYFYAPGGEDRTSIYDQWRAHQKVNTLRTYTYIHSGFKGDKDYNYINDIYPEQTELMDYRWRYGGYDVTWLEYRLNKTYVLKTFTDWYSGPRAVPFNFVADEITVKGFTDIAKTDTRYIFERDEHILEELLGPRHCIAWDDDGNCTTVAYGDFLPLEDDPENGISLWDAPPESDWPSGEVPEHNFNIIYNPQFESYTDEYIQGDIFKQICFTQGLSPTDAFYAVEYSNGKIGGQTIFDNGRGNEYRYFISFRDFLKEQGWTVDDFMNIYAKEIGDRVDDLTEAVTKNTHVQPVDFSEFYDKNHKAPFDNIQFYTPMIPNLGGTVRVDKREVLIDQDGNETFSDVKSEQLLDGQFLASIDQSEFVYAVAVSKSLRTFISDYTKIKLVVNFKTSFATTTKVKLRVSTSDFTYLNEREFRYYA